MTETNKVRFKYIVSDIFSVIVSYFVVFAFSDTHENISKIFIRIPFFILIFTISGYYNKPFAKSRIKEFISTIISIAVILCSEAILFNFIESNGHLLFFLLSAVLFSTTYLLRLCITFYYIQRERKGLRKINVFIIKNGKIGEDTKKWILQLTNRNIIGEVDFTKDINEILSYYNDVNSKNIIAEIIIASNNDSMDNSMDKLDSIVAKLITYNIPIYISAKGFAKIGIRNKVDSLFGEPLVELTQTNMNEFQKNVKFIFDKIFATILLVCTSPIFVIVAILIKINSKGNIIYKQERIGLNGRPFLMYKFRSMYSNSEPNGPELSKDGDKRITSVGIWIRKYRIDELPQLYNVIKGDMSIVGPRPERDFYIKQLVQIKPNYRLLQNIKPGITSWGIVKFGYASNINEMVERFDLDWIYYQNMSITLDITIIIYTIKTLISGYGK